MENLVDSFTKITQMAIADRGMSLQEQNAPAQRAGIEADSKYKAALSAKMEQDVAIDKLNYADMENEAAGWKEMGDQESVDRDQLGKAPEGFVRRRALQNYVALTRSSLSRPGAFTLSDAIKLDAMVEHLDTAPTADAVDYRQQKAILPRLQRDGRSSSQMRAAGIMNRDVHEVAGQGLSLMMTHPDDPAKQISYGAFLNHVKSDDIPAVERARWIKSVGENQRLPILEMIKVAEDKKRLPAGIDPASKTIEYEMQTLPTLKDAQMLSQRSKLDIFAEPGQMVKTFGEIHRMVANPRSDDSIRKELGAEYMDIMKRPVFIDLQDENGTQPHTIVDSIVAYSKLTPEKQQAATASLPPEQQKYWHAAITETLKDKQFAASVKQQAQVQERETTSLLNADHFANTLRVAASDASGRVIADKTSPDAVAYGLKFKAMETMILESKDLTELKRYKAQIDTIREDFSKIAAERRAKDPTWLELDSKNVNGKSESIWTQRGIVDMMALKISDQMRKLSTPATAKPEVVPEKIETGTTQGGGTISKLAPAVPVAAPFVPVQVQKTTPVTPPEVPPPSSTPLDDGALNNAVRVYNEYRGDMTTETGSKALLSLYSHAMAKGDDATADTIHKLIRSRLKQSTILRESEAGVALDQRKMNFRNKLNSVALGAGVAAVSIPALTVAAGGGLVTTVAAIGGLGYGEIKLQDGMKKMGFSDADVGIMGTMSSIGGFGNTGNGIAGKAVKGTYATIGNMMGKMKSLGVVGEGETIKAAVAAGKQTKIAATAKTYLTEVMKANKVEAKIAKQILEHPVTKDVAVNAKYIELVEPLPGKVQEAIRAYNTIIHAIQ